MSRKISITAGVLIAMTLLAYGLFEQSEGIEAHEDDCWYTLAETSYQIDRYYALEISEADIQDIIEHYLWGDKDVLCNEVVVIPEPTPTPEPTPEPTQTPTPTQTSPYQSEQEACYRNQTGQQTFFCDYDPIKQDYVCRCVIIHGE